MKRLAISILFILCLGSAVSALPNEGFVSYTSGSLNISRARVWNGAQVSNEVNLVEQQSNINWIVSAASPRRQEHIEVEIRADGSVIANVFRQSLFTSKTLTTVMSSLAASYEGATVVYEQQSGRAVIIYANDSDTAAYEIWNGTSFIGGGSLLTNDSCRGIPRWLRSAADKNSNNIMLLELDTTASHCAQTWDGTAWTNPHFLVDTDLPSSVGPRADVAFENSGEALVVFESDAEGALRYATWNGAWSSSAQLNAMSSDVVSWVRLASSSFGNDIALTAYAKSNSTATAIVWNGSAWQTPGVISAAIKENKQRPIDLAYVGDTLIVAYEDVTGLRYGWCLGANCYTGSWVSSSVATLQEATYVQLASSPLSSQLLLGLTTDVLHEKWVARYNGSWQTLQFIGNGTAKNSAEDLSVVLDLFNDTAAPTVANLTPVAGSDTSPVTIGADVEDYGVVDNVLAVITNPLGVVTTVQLSNVSGARYETTMIPTIVGVHTITFIANDSAGNVNASMSTWFNYSHLPPSVSILTPADLSSFSNGTSVAFAGNASLANGSQLPGSSLAWYSDVDGFLGSGSSIVVGLSTAVHTVTLFATDSLNYTGNVSILIEFFPDRDQDGLADTPDTLEGDESWVTTSGVESLDVLVNDNTSIRRVAYLETQMVNFRDGTESLVDLLHNFSVQELDLSTITIIVDAEVLLFSSTSDLVDNESKTVYFGDNGFTNLCVKSTAVTSASQISDSCTASDETDFTACLGSSMVINGITCTDTGSQLVFSNMTTVAIEGQTPSPPSGGSNGGGGSSGYGGSGGAGGGSGGSSRSSGGSGGGSSGSSGGGPKDNQNDDEGKSISQSITPKAPEEPAKDPVPIKEKSSTRRYWPWLLGIIGLLLFILSYITKEKKEEEQDSFGFNKQDPATLSKHSEESEQDSTLDYFERSMKQK